MGEDGNVSVLSCFRSLTLIGLLAVAAFAEAGKVTLKDGAISYSDGAARSVVRTGGPCSDLWVSPDGEMIAFIRIDRSRPNPGAIAPFIERSTIFVASRSTGFKPARVALDHPPRVDRREWNVFRDPVLSPARRTVYFLVPAAGTSYFLMSVPVAGGTARPITWVEAYCVLWGGATPGDLLAVIRGEPPDDTRGVTHLYYHYGASGSAEQIGTREHDGDWRDVVRAWAHKYGGTCEANIN